MVDGADLLSMCVCLIVSTQLGYKLSEGTFHAYLNLFVTE